MNLQEDTRKSSTDPQHVRKFDVSHETGCSSIERELKKTIFPEILKARQVGSKYVMNT